MIKCLEASSPKQERDIELFRNDSTTPSDSKKNMKNIKMEFSNVNRYKTSTSKFRALPFDTNKFCKRKERHLHFDMRQQVIKNNLSKSLKGMSSRKFRSYSESTDDTRSLHDYITVSFSGENMDDNPNSETLPEEKRPRWIITTNSIFIIIQQALLFLLFVYYVR